MFWNQLFGQQIPSTAFQPTLIYRVRSPVPVAAARVGVVAFGISRHAALLEVIVPRAHLHEDDEDTREVAAHETYQRFTH